MQDHLLPVYLAQPVRELSRLVCVHFPLGFIHIDEDIEFFLCWGKKLGTWMWGFGLGGAHSLELIMLVALLGLLGLWEVPVHILYGNQWPCEVVTVPDALEPRFFGGKPCGRMEVLDCARQDWELIHIVDSPPCCLVVIESLNVSNECCGCRDGVEGV